MSEENLVLFTQVDRVGLFQLNRPKVKNALNPAMMQALVDQLEAIDGNPQHAIRCIVLTGGPDFFAAGADISCMAKASALDMMTQDPLGLSVWDRIAQIKTPMIAAVNGYALGGGCELAMMCDMIIASETARFGQPEISIGVIPGAGGTQRLTRQAGKALSMELILTGRPFSAAEALSLGLVNRIVSPESTIEEALTLAKTISEKPAMAVRMAKEAVLEAFEQPLEQGLRAERRLFHLLFNSPDQKEGMNAFLEKRPAVWQ